MSLSNQANSSTAPTGRRSIGSLEVSVVGLGCNNFGTSFNTPVDLDGTRAVIDQALDLGIDFLDTADVYGESEAFLGEILRGRRHHVVLATKFARRLDGDRPVDASASWVRRAVDQSLTRLQTDYIDLYQMHFSDPDTPIEETLAALDELIRSGKVREIGASNLSIDQLRESADVAGARQLQGFASIQNEFSLLRPEPRESLLSTCRELGIAFVPFAPLANGILSGKYRRGVDVPPDSRLAHRSSAGTADIWSAEVADAVERLRSQAEHLGLSLLQLAFAWLLHHPEVKSVIAGATRPEQIAVNVEAGTRVLSDSEFEDVTRVVESLASGVITSNEKSGDEGGA